MPRPRSLAVLTAALLLPGCSRGSAADLSSPARVAGEYVYAGRGNTLTVPWDFKAELELRRSGDYELTLDIMVKGEREHEVDRGRFEVHGDQVLLTTRGDPPQSHTLYVRGDSLAANFDWKGRLALRLARVPQPVFVKVDR